jgi:hypothetical protein
VLWLLLAIGIAVVIAVTTVNIVMSVRAMNRGLAAERAALAAETIVLDSGWVDCSLHLRNYRDAHHRTGVTVRVARCQLVLTHLRLAVLGMPLPAVPLAELHRYAVASTGRRLQLVTDEPLQADGHVDLRVAVAAPDAWLAKLVDAGARRGDG